MAKLYFRYGAMGSLKSTRYSNGKIVREGAQIMLGSNESYVALCRKHYKEGKLWK